MTVIKATKRKIVKISEAHYVSIPKKDIEKSGYKAGDLVDIQVKPHKNKKED